MQQGQKIPTTHDLQGKMKKILIIWLCWTGFWAAVTQGFYFVQMQETRAFMAQADKVTGKVKSIDSQVRREVSGNASGNTSFGNTVYVNKTYYRIVAQYNYNNVNYTHRFGFTRRHPDIAVGDSVNLYVLPQEPHAPRLETDTNKYAFLKYGWIVMAIFPIFLGGPAVVLLLIASKILPISRMSELMMSSIKSAEKTRDHK
jgi:hypothetical protein